MHPSSSTIEHVGEWRVLVRGASLEALLAEVARLVAGAAGPAAGPAGSWERVVVEGRDEPALLVDWANELIGRGEVEQRGYGEVRDLAIAREGEALVARAEVRGRSVPAWRSPLKAATYHGADVQRADGEWRAEMLFDV